MITLVLALVLSILPAPAESFDGVVIPYCRLPGARCIYIGEDPPAIEPAASQLNWCCGLDGGNCVQVNSIVWCDEDLEYAVICEWGMMTTEGDILCFDGQP